MKKNFFLTLMLLMLALFNVQPTAAQTDAVTGLLDRIGGDGAAERFEIVIDETLNTNGKDVFVIKDGTGKPRIEGSNILAVTTGINWYLNHYAHINLTWNKLSTDLVNATLPLPGETVTKECSADLRYYLNYCTFSYTSALWTEERWMQEIDWMALHGINMPLMLVGLDCVWYDLYTKEEYGYNYTADEINAHIAGPAFQAWWAMINCEGHGGPNRDWWYERSRALATNMLARMRSFGMEPVLPGFCGEVPSSLKSKLNNDSEINTGGSWQGFPAPGLMGHKSSNWETLAANYYNALEGVMGTSKYYSMDPFHEEATGLTGNSAGDMEGYFQSCYAQMKANVGEGVVWVAQDWSSNPRSAMLSGLNKGELIVLDLFAESDPHYSGGYSGHDYIYCMLHNFGGRVGLHGRFNKTMDGYYAALAARGDEMVGIGATPEGVENNPMLYDMLFELSWRETAPDKTEWVNDYTVSRYGEENATVQSAYSRLMQSVYNCTTSQQGTSEPIICAIPSLTATKVSSWASAAVDYDHEIVIAAADEMLSQINEFDASNDNFNYDLLDVVRQALTNYALDMLAQLNSDYTANGFDATFSARKDHYLALIEDIDELLGTHQKFRLGNWAEMARAIVEEDAASTNGAEETDADWLEYDNLRRQITTWAPFWSSLRDYSNREWNGLVKDYYLERWKVFFEALENGTTGSLTNDYWYNYGNTYVYDDTKTYSAEPVGDTKTVARNSFDNYFFVDIDDESNKVYFSRHIEQSKSDAEYVKYAYRENDFTFAIPTGTTATLSVDANNDGVFGDGETVSSNTFTIPADAATTSVKALIVLSDNTEISFYVYIADLIEADRTVTVQAGDNGSVAITGTSDLSITNSEYVTMTATGNSGYEFSHWVQVADDATETEVSRENPFIYLGKDEATFKAYFIQNIWGVPAEDWADSGDITNAQYLTSITCTQEGNTTEIYSASEATENLFVPVATMINAAKGSQFTINWQGDGNMKYCYLSAYIDLNKDGDFEDEGELLMVKGTLSAQNSAVETGPLTVLLPLDMPIGITHIRLRFDGAWKSGYDATTKAFPAANTINRRCYEIVLNVTEYAAGSSHIVITSNNAEWGYVRNITGVTGEDINVPSGTEICMEAFPNEGYEFVHWLDKYNRVISTDASFYYIPSESGEFTAVFKKIAQETVEIDGWEFRIGRQPGSVAKTNKLATGVKPEEGKIYYIYAPTRPTNDGEYVNRYLYNNSGTLTLSTTESTAASYLWLCSVEDGKYVFQNVSDPTKYLKHKGLASAPYGFELGTGTTYYEGITMQSVPGDGETRNLFFVINDNGSGFNQSTRTHNQSTEDYTTDFVFVEVSYPDEIILTEVITVGNNDLTVPETVMVDGVECNIVGFGNNLFINNKDLWSITLPETMEFVSNNVVFSTSFNGTITPEPSNTTKMNSSDSQIIDLGGYALENNKAWTLDIAFESDGSLYNKWGNVLLAGGENATTNHWLYLTSVDNGRVHLRVLFGGLYVDNGTNYFKDLTLDKTSTFRVSIANQGDGTAIVTVTNSEGTSLASSAVSFSPNGVTKLSSLMPTGVNITELKILEGSEDPFEGCTNLDEIAIDGTCANYYVNDSDGGLYNSSDVLISMPAGKEKGEKFRELATLVEEFSTLIEQVAIVDPVGTNSKITLQTGDDDTAGYIWTNAEDPSEGSLDYLVDGIKGDNNNFFHSNYHTVSTTEGYHYIEVDLGENNDVTNFKFSYRTRSNDADLANFPTSITVMGSNNKTDYTDNIFSVTSGLPQSNNTDYTSEIFSTQKVYRYLRFKVGAPSVFWHMGEFELYNVTSSADVYGIYETMGITDALVAGDYDALATAIYVLENGTTADEMTAQIEIIEPLYEALKAKIKDPLNGVYNINFGGKPLFIAYAAANELDGLTGAGNAGFRLFDATTTNTDSKHSTIQNNAIAAQAPADALFTIVPKDDNSGYHLSAQGLYMNTVTSGWSMQALDTDVANAGVYLFEETETDDIFKIKSTTAEVPYVNDWGPVLGNDLSSKSNLSTFTLTPVAEYTVTVPATGVTTLCLPFNVVIPAGVEVYDITASDITTVNGNKAYSLNSVAVEGEILAKGTPVIVKADAGNVNFTITMDFDGAKSSTEGSVLRSGLVKTTIGTAEVNYTFSDGVFNKVTANTEVAANQCWMLLDEDAGDMIVDEEVAQGLFMYTTDEENPILYRIQVNRDFNNPAATVLQYNEKEGYVNIARETDNASYQAWYFMESTNGFVIKPYNAMRKVLGADDNGNGGTKVWTVEINTKNIDEWTLEKNGDWYNILGDGKCFSNHGGGNPGTMGFYNDKSDGGSQFKFIPMTFDNDNPRYYQLKDYTATIDADVALSLANGDPGSYVNGQLYIDAFNDANTLAAGENTAAAADCYSAYTALRTAGDNLAAGGYVPFTDGALYRIKNYVKNATGNKYHYLKNNGASVAFATSVDNDDCSAMWVCNVNGDNNVSFVSALGTLTLGWKVGANDAAVLTPEKSNTWMAFGIMNDQNKYLVLENGNTFGEADAMSVASANSSTDWCFETVDDATLAKYSLKMKKSYEWSTLYLPFAVTVPAGVKAYIATTGPVTVDGENVIELNEVENVVPANTAVILKRESAVAAETFNFVYAQDAEIPNVDGNIFAGRITEGYIGGADMGSKNFYILFRGDEGERLYWIYKEYDADGNKVENAADNYIKCAANKAYLALDAAASGASSYSFRFGGTTGIDEVNGENCEAETIYDLQGRKLTEITEPGVYIIDGNKVLVK